MVCAGVYVSCVQGLAIIMSGEAIRDAAYEGNLSELKHLVGAQPGDIEASDLDVWMFPVLSCDAACTHAMYVMYGVAGCLWSAHADEHTYLCGCVCMCWYTVYVCTPYDSSYSANDMVRVTAK